MRWGKLAPLLSKSAAQFGQLSASLDSDLIPADLGCEGRAVCSFTMISDTPGKVLRCRSRQGECPAPGTWSGARSS